MKGFSIALCLVSALGAHAGAPVLSSSTTDWGSVTYKLEYFSLNESSSLTRSWIVVNDLSSAIQIKGTRFSISDWSKTNSSYKPIGVAVPNSRVVALEIRHILFDVFGKHLRTLTKTELVDLDAGTNHPLVDSTSWAPTDLERKKLLTVVSFVAQVRMADGNIWRCNDAALVTEIKKHKLQLELGHLVPSKDE